jgi:nucleoside-diphosphate-sugar epimerase
MAAAPLVLVTGGTGFIGRHLCRRLAAEGCRPRLRVRVLCREPAALGDLAGVVEAAPGDVTRPETLAAALAGADTVYHLASALGATPFGPQGFEAVNAGGTRNVLQAAQAAGVRRVVHCSSVGVLGSVAGPPAHEDAPLKPEDDYERTKAQGELIARKSAAAGLPVVIVRPGWAYGPGDRRTFKLVRAIARRRFFFVGDGATRTHPVYIDDLVEGLAACRTAELPRGEVITLAGDEIVSIEELCRAIAGALGVPLTRLHVPREPLRTLAWGLEAAFKLAGREAPLTRAKVDFFLKHRAYDTANAKRLLGFAPRTDLAAGLAKAIAWYRENGWL